ncbi:hypothetical protein [Nocardia jejuensis]|uniref:hypothetical protein n=1 Tax=Nocardia jejuensis TaxID=328049 RepID=UPI00082DF3BA|nr:hypothetical protein [Nocardia jejuensis]
MGTQLGSILYGVLIVFRWLGLVALTIASMAIMISEATKNKLSPSKVFGITGSAVFAAVLFWVLPTVISYARFDSGSVIPDFPIGKYGQ